MPHLLPIIAALSMFLVNFVDAAEPPPLGLTVPCRVTEVYDGDTVTVELRLIARVRLLDCWAPEIRTTDPAEKRRGFDSRDHLRSIADGKEGVLHIPAAEARRMDDLITLGRVLGHVWVDGRNLSAQQVESSHATSAKRE